MIKGRVNICCRQRGPWQIECLGNGRLNCAQFQDGLVALSLHLLTKIASNSPLLA